MEILVHQIKSVLEKEKHCFVRPDQLHRVWPGIGDDERETTVRKFAREHGWQIFTYSRALGAMFVRDTPAGRKP